MKRIALFVFFVCSWAWAQAQQVDTVLVKSAAMTKAIKNVIIVPENYTQETARRYPVLYLLHGYSGNHSSWIKTKPNLPEIASRYGMIIVCPDGQNSWYWDSPTDLRMSYETYVSKELVQFMDKEYRTLPDVKSRAITGLSMGGHGALWLGIRHQDVFGSCGSMSGGVDIRPFPENWQMKNQLGEYAENPELWDKYTVINQVHKIKGGKLNIIIDCGTGDFFFKVNQALHEKLMYMNIPHDYIERPGVHNGPYWENAIDYQILFFAKQFGVYKN